MVEGELVLCDSVDAIRDQVKRIRFVLRHDTLPVNIPPEVIYQKLNRREWIVTVSPFSKELVIRIQTENSCEDTTVIDLSLEEIFKDLVRGRKASVGEGA